MSQPAEHRPIVIAGGGMVGLTLAIDLHLQGAPVLVLEKGHTIGEGSRAICHAKRTLEIWDRLGAGEAIRDKGAVWKVGRLFHREKEVYAFDLLPESGHKMPAFVNLQQDQVEEVLRARYAEIGGEIRFGHALTAVSPREDGVDLTVEGPDGAYAIDADWLVSCEGVRSITRRALDLPFSGDIFEDKFLISDVRFTGAPFPPERWFWFQPPFHEGQTALLHKQADDVWRIDLQLSAEADQETERQPERVRPRIERMLNRSDFDIVWTSVYVFQCRTLDRYVHGRVIFAGDSAHQVSPFGARGGNGGVQDADALAWRLARIVSGESPTNLLDAYNEERHAAAEENILNSRRATDFMSPKTPLSMTLRDETLALAAEAPFARALVNSGRLSAPAHFPTAARVTPDAEAWTTGRFAPGSPALDAPIKVGGEAGFLLQLLTGGFVVVTGAADAPAHIDVAGERVRVAVLGRDFTDPEGLVARRYDLTPDAMLLFAPDQHMIARRRAFDSGAIEDAVRRALGLSEAIDAAA